MLDRIKNKISREIVDLFFKIGVDSFIYAHKKGAAIIMYHGVDLYENKRFNQRHVGIDTFKKQVLWLKKNCNVVSVEDYFNNRLDITKFNVAITFDDGYLNNYKYAFPVLEKNKIPATFYITGVNHTEHKILWSDTNNFLQNLYPNNNFEIDNLKFIKKANDFVEVSSQKKLSTYCRTSDYEFKNKLSSILIREVNIETDDLVDYWKLMTSEQIKEVSKSKYVGIGSHGWFHNNLGNIEYKYAKQEISKSKFFLENLTQKEISSIAYPDGSYSKKVKDFSFKQGLRYQLAVDYKFDDDELDTRIINRHGIYPVYSWSHQITNIF